MTQVSRARLCILVGCVLAIEALCRTGVISSFSMIPPSEMAIGLANILVAGNLNSGILRTLTDVFYAFPSILLAVAIAGALGSGLGNALVAIIIVFVPSITRVTESVTTQVRSMHEPRLGSRWRRRSRPGRRDPSSPASIR